MKAGERMFSQSLSVEVQALVDKSAHTEFGTRRCHYTEEELIHLTTKCGWQRIKDVEENKRQRQEV